jgi:hypothetical protein
MECVVPGYQDHILMKVEGRVIVAFTFHNVVFPTTNELLLMVLAHVLKPVRIVGQRHHLHWSSIIDDLIHVIIFIYHIKMPLFHVALEIAGPIKNYLSARGVHAANWAVLFNLGSSDHALVAFLDVISPRLFPRQYFLTSAALVGTND